MGKLIYANFYVNCVVQLIVSTFFTKHYVVLVVYSVSHVSDSFATPWAVARQAPLDVGFSRQEYWSRLPLSSPRGSSQLRDQTHISFIGRQILYC